MPPGIQAPIPNHQKIRSKAEWHPTGCEHPTSDQRIAKTDALEPAEVQIRRENFRTQAEGDGGDLRIGSRVSSGSRHFQQLKRRLINAS